MTTKEYFDALFGPGNYKLTPDGKLKLKYAGPAQEKFMNEKPKERAFVGTYEIENDDDHS